VRREPEPNINPQDEIINLLKEQLEQVRKELEFKNKQIEELQAQLKASSERETNYQHLLNQQQTLNGMDKQKILLLENETTKKKKGIFGIFKKKDKENNVNGEGE
jgi:septal ring factor EnvC (AmiA/AmiB activator)